MKNLSIILIIPTMLSMGCKQHTSELTANEKTKIEQEITSIMEEINEGVNIHDADQISSHCLKNEDYIYVGNGHVTKGFDTYYRGASEIQSNPKYRGYTIRYEEMIIKPLSRDMVMLIGDCYLDNFPFGDSTISQKIAITLLFEKINDTWQLTIGHESMPAILN